MTELEEFQSRNEAILRSIIDGTEYVALPQSRIEELLLQLKEVIVAGGGSVSPEDIQAAIEEYLNTHDADIVTEQELAEALGNYTTTADLNTALGSKADAADIPDVSGFIGADADNLENYYDKSAVDTALAGKSDTGHAHDDRYYTEAEVDAALSGKSDSGHSHVVTDVTGLESALAGKSAASHAHDDRYYTETEIDGKLGEKSNTGHAHDERYYTQTAMDALLEGKADSADVPDVSAFITRLVDDLVNYYTKSETYTKTEIDNMVSAIPKFAIQVVNSLPTQNISPTTVYLLTSQTQENGNLYTEYLYVGNSWELLGSQTVDLSGYYTAAEVDALLNGLSVSGHTHDDRYYTESEIDGKVQEINSAIAGKATASHTHDDRYYTETEIDNKLSEKSNAGHSHVFSDVTGLDSALAGKADATATQTALNAKQDALTAGDNVSIARVNGVLTISATDTDTWVANSSSAAGYVASGSGQANKVWKTDANGNPAWRDETSGSGLQVDVLFSGGGGAGATLSSSSPLTLTSPLTSSHKFVEIYYGSSLGGILCTKGPTVSGSTLYSINLTDSLYNSSNTSFYITAGYASVSGNQITVNSGSFTVYYVAAYR